MSACGGNMSYMRLSEDSEGSSSGGFFTFNKAKYLTNGGFPGWIKIILIILLVIVIIFAGMNIGGYIHIKNHPKQEEQISDTWCTVLIVLNGLIIFISVVMIGYMIATFFINRSRARQAAAAAAAAANAASVNATANATAAGAAAANQAAVAVGATVAQALEQGGSSTEEARAQAAGAAVRFKAWFTNLFTRKVRQSSGCPEGCVPQGRLADFQAREKLVAGTLAKQEQEILNLQNALNTYSDSYTASLLSVPNFPSPMQDITSRLDAL